MLRELILNKDFSSAYDLIGGNLTEPIKDEIITFAYEDGNEIYYEFFKYVIDNHEDSAKTNYYAAELMVVALNILPNGYSLAFKHALRAVELEPNSISYQEFLLLFNAIPDRLLDKFSASQIAQNILKKDPENRAAIEILKKCNTSA